MSYHARPADTVRNAAALVRAGAGAVKLEGGRRRIPVVRAILDAEIPVMGHLGLTPQSVHAMGGYSVQGKDGSRACQLEDDAMRPRRHGLLRPGPRRAPRRRGGAGNRRSACPTIGIGAGPACDGQVLVFHDLLGLASDRRRSSSAATPTSARGHGGDAGLPGTWSGRASRTGRDLPRLGRAATQSRRGLGALRGPSGRRSDTAGREDAPAGARQETGGCRLP